MDYNRKQIINRIECLKSFLNNLKIQDGNRPDEVVFSFDGDEMDFFVMLKIEQEIAPLKARLYTARKVDNGFEVTIRAVSDNCLLFK